MHFESPQNLTAQSQFCTGERAAFVSAMLSQAHTLDICASPQCMNCPSNRKRDWTDQDGFFFGHITPCTFLALLK